MAVNTSKSSEVWYVDSGTSNHMMSHEEWFSYLEKLEQQGVVETADDTLHTIEHVGEVPLSHVRQKGKLMNVLHILTKTSVRSSTRGCKFDSHTSGVTSKRKAKLLRKGAVKGGCSSLTPIKLEPRCSRKDRRLSQTSTCGISGSTKLTSHGFVKCRRRILFSDCRNFGAVMAKSAKPANVGSSTDFHSPMSVIVVEIRWI